MNMKELPDKKVQLNQEDDSCDLDPTKICDNCMKCVLGESDYSAVTITGIQLNDEE